MVNFNKSRFKPRFKKLANSKIVISNKRKILRFNKQKWEKQKTQFLRLSTTKKRNCYYKFYDQRAHNVPRFMNRFGNRYTQVLRSKRRLKLFYGNLSKNYVASAMRKSILRQNAYRNRPDIKYFLLGRLESRLDVLLLRSCFVSSLRAARQLISHGHVKVNNKTVKINSFVGSIGDKIELSQSVHSLIEYKLGNSVLWPIPPKYLQISYKIFQIIIIEDVSYSNFGNSLPGKFDVNLILSSYRR
tara:strand:+ start:2484 stop:3215 length:732 start_codon:yes stop_codon:yes gene_type:complete